MIETALNQDSKHIHQSNCLHNRERGRERALASHNGGGDDILIIILNSVQSKGPGIDLDMMFMMERGRDSEEKIQRA